MAKPKTHQIMAASYLGLGIVAPITGPVNNSLPVITGTVKVANVLTSTTGTWDGSPTFTRQWKAAGVNISGATAATYTPVSGDIGKAITVAVTGTLNSIPLTKTSAPTVAVVA